MLKDIKDVLVQKATEAAGHVIQDQLDAITHHLAIATLSMLLQAQNHQSSRVLVSTHPQRIQCFVQLVFPDNINTPVMFVAADGACQRMSNALPVTQGMTESLSISLMKSLLV